MVRLGGDQMDMKIIMVLKKQPKQLEHTSWGGVLKKTYIKKAEFDNPAGMEVERIELLIIS
jgi:hypothetical protein